MSGRLAALSSGNVIRSFRMLKTFNIDEFCLLVVQMHHEKSGANLIHLLRDDPNRAFGVQFRTTPFDDSGMPHILEHTALCGSQKYPVRDPFFKMLRRSQATFMNAYTASDWTMYPFSTMNEIDYQNLRSVYIDAAFFPILSKMDFMQEGWRLEPEKLDDSSSKLLLKGVVYNEMKGVFSNSLNLLAQTVENNLLPVSYGHVSGGHPDAIPSLSLEALKKFHSTFYHPSNATFYTYGNVDLDECLEALDTECLSKFNVQSASPQVPLEPRWTEPRRIKLTCQPDPTLADPSRSGVVSVSFALTDICDIYTNFALSIALCLLIDGDSAPLYQGLIESGLGLDWTPPVHGMDRSIRTTCFHVGLQGVQPGTDAERVEAAVMEILAKTVKTGFPKERVEAVLHRQEIALREDNARFGLQVILGLAGVVNHGGDVQTALSAQQMVDRFKSDLAADPEMLQKLIDHYLVQNPHRLCVTMLPDAEFEAKQKVKETQRLEKAISGMSAEKREELLKDVRELAEKQKNQTEEDVSCLPCLSLLDIPPKCRPEPFTEMQIGETSVNLNQAPTNGLVYLHTLANVSDLPQDLLIYLPIFTSLFSQLGADGLTYQEMDLLQELYTGSFCAVPHAVASLSAPEAETKPCTRHVHISTYCLADRVPRMLELLYKRLSANNWYDRARISTLLAADAASQWSANALSHSAHHFAMRRASANLCSLGRMSELWGGVEQAAFMRHLTARLITRSDAVERDRAFNDFIAKMRAIADHLLLRQARFRFSLHGEEDNLAPACKQLEAFLTALPLKVIEKEEVKLTPDPPALKSNNAFITLPYSVHYASLALPAPYYTSPEFPVYRVLSKLLNSAFLHTAIREQGGAYGGGSCVGPGQFAFYSYRDPSAGATLRLFEESLDFALSNEFKEQEIVEAKLSVFQEFDSPVSAGSRGLHVFLTGIDDEERQNQRERLFTVDAVALKQAAQRLHDHLVCAERVGRAVLGPRDAKMEEDKKMGQKQEWDAVDLSQTD
ncbi:Presequence protease [Echinococcus granulosus]|uniref:Presequence protease, mitochondrial n=1 Tax=Echinococcus granulosus TaxID=6210 RepID=W6UB11_ECHGR|nr:Presequence protease [Echinococcus granulosus]EUB58568.1 Presequence protease [Echinococcus granulosus]